MALRPVFYIVGLLLILLGVSMLAPVLVVLYMDSYDWGGFVYGAAITLFFGVMMTLANQHALDKIVLGVREAFLLTTLSWVFTIAFASLPFLLSAHPQSVTDSLFESTSALTTTGATVIKSLAKSSPGILLWRSILQWLGGIGIIVMALTILPMLRIGGMQLFRTESSERSERNLPRVSQIAKAILSIQGAFTLLFSVALLVAGLGPMDAVCHAMTALTTGGLSTLDASIEGFANPWVEIILVVAMIMGSCTLLLMVRVCQGDWRAFVTNPQIRWFLSIIGVMTFVMILWRLYHMPNAPILQISRECLFMVVSTISSTGFTVANYTTWGSFATLLLFMATFIGGCTGSTTGGLKIFRIQVLWTVLKTQMAQLRRPHGVFLPHYNNQVLSDGVISSVFTFFGLFGLTFGAVALALSFCEIDPLASISASAAVITNTGVGIGADLGKYGSFAAMSDPAKWTLMVGMLLGRLEMMTIVALLLPGFWRR
jgi:trk system potassium uptake protein TrkH